MSSESSYVFGEADRARIEAAEELLDEGSIRLLSRLGVGPKQRCLEVGAGGGSIARWLSDAVGPSGRVVATDIDTGPVEQLPRANLEPRRHDIVQEPLDETFDLIYARLLLEHLPERDAVLDKLVNALAPGGWLLVEDVDYVSGVPVSILGATEHERVQSVRLQEFGRRGVDSYLGRQLPDRLRAQGLIGVGNAGRVWVMEGGSACARWFKLSLAHLRGQLVGSGKLSEAEVETMLTMFDAPGFAALSPIIMAAWGQRPA